jgi:hypothetical protein
MTKDSKTDRKPEPSFGPDEEGEVPLKEDAIPRHDKAAWVHEGKERNPPRG